MTPVAKLRKMVGLSPAWQAAVGLTGEPTDAIARVAFANELAANPRPHAVVSSTGMCAWSRISGGLENSLRPRGVLDLYLSRDIPTGVDTAAEELADREDALAWFMEVMADVALLSGQDDPDEAESHLSLVELRMGAVQQSLRETQRSAGRYWHTVIEVEYGD
jgi:hypothetical protein